MYTVSAAFAALLARAHTIAVRAEVTDGLTNTVIATLDVTGGTVTVDGSNDVRRQCTVTLADPTGALVPTQAMGLLHPSTGHELRLYRGIAAASLGADELVPLGVFRLTRPRVSDRGDQLTITLTGYDRAKKVQRARFTDVYTIAAGTDYATAIQTMLTSRVPSLTFDFQTTTAVTPTLQFAEKDDPWKRALEMATSLGMQLYFDPAGVCVLRPEPSPATDRVAWTYAEGDAATILSVDKDLDEEQQYNHAIVTGERSDGAAPVRAEAWDDNPASPTYWQGPYGDVPDFYSSKYITTVTQAQQAADALLRKKLGVLESLELNAIVHPGHEAGDVIRVTRTRMGLSAALYALDRVTVPMGADQPLAASARRVVV